MVYFVLVIRLDRWVRERDRVLLMGVINVTPDSFFPASRVLSPRLAVECAQRMVEDGADILDIGGESTRPGAAPVSVDEELERVLPVIEKVHSECDVVLSVDTTKADVAREALARGASIVNDTSALQADPDMAPLVAERSAYVILMHMQGTPRTMQQAPHYDDVTAEVLEALDARVQVAARCGIPRDRIFIDPGIGFGKRLEHSLALLRNTDRFAATGLPVVVGVSRKSFLGDLLGLPAAERLEGTLAAQAVAVALGADILRVHDVKEGRRAADTARLLRK
ncbi:MAG: dihydropteroate synthase [Candidatus Bipolaricaulota bacterium]|nr:dihydropteroate synthase [Candidatus Bipolaricaulota bacterium]